jgi:hypothetical protein
MPAGGDRISLIVAHAEGWCEATARFSRTLRSSNSSIDCQVRASPSRARRWGSRDDRSIPSNEAGDGVDERRLPRSVGADQPDELGLADCEIDVDERSHAAEAHRDPGGLKDARHHSAPGSVGSGSRPSSFVPSRAESVRVPALRRSCLFR